MMQEGIDTLIGLYPLPEATCVCPVCTTEAQPVDFRFFSKHIFAACECKICGLIFYSTLPVGHAHDHPFCLSNDGNYTIGGQPWLTLPVKEAMKQRMDIDVIIRLKSSGQRFPKKVLLHHTLDDCYGHVLARLINAHELKRLYPDYYILLLIPSNFEWMVSPGLADELWTVEVEQLGSFRMPLRQLDEFAHKQFRRFRQVDLAVVPVVPKKELVNYESLFGVSPFITDDLYSSLHITFLWREDRLWLNWSWQYILQLAATKLGWMPLVRNYFCGIQRRLVNRLYNKLKTNENDLSFTVIGLGTFGGFNFGINDARSGDIDEATERSWCLTYSQSHVVTGVHGSHMMIPTALAGGFVQLVPDDKHRHRGEDILQKINNLSGCSRQKFVGQFVSASRLAREITKMAKGIKEGKKRRDNSKLSLFP